jgi:2-hydroxychromene-2-carboxylate isomerase
LSRVEALSSRLKLHYRPVLFAGLLHHWGHKGPAEIEAKRIWTYRWCTWVAMRQGIPFTFPAAHPFNPLPYLRIACAADSEPMAVRTLFDALWTTGADPAAANFANGLAARIGVDPAQLGTEQVKAALRAHTEEAIARGIFGVPTLVLDDHLFWGIDGMDLAEAYLLNPAILDSAAMKRASFLPFGVARRPAPTTR